MYMYTSISYVWQGSLYVGIQLTDIQETTHPWEGNIHKNSPLSRNIYVKNMPLYEELW